MGIFSSVKTLIYFILMMGIIIFIHEFGHMLLAKRFNVYVREFALGFGPKIFSKQGKETLYTLRAIPLGGFNGMVETEETPIEFDENGNPTKIFTIEKERTFYGVAIWKRILILLAGPVFNLMLACLVFSSIFQINGFVNVYPAPVITAVDVNYPAYAAGLKAGDVIKKISTDAGQHVEPGTFYDIIVLNQNKKDTLTFTVEREGQILEIRVTPQYNEEEKRYIIGISAGEMIQKKITFLEGFVEGAKYTWYIITATFQAIARLFVGQGLEDLGGTISIYRYTEEAASYGFLSILSLMGSLSVSVGLMNLIPIPIFDGGRIVLCLIEKVVGHRLSEKTENIVMYIGLGLVFILFVFVTIQDITKLFH